MFAPSGFMVTLFLRLRLVAVGVGRLSQITASLESAARDWVDRATLFEIAGREWMEHAASFKIIGCDWMEQATSVEIAGRDWMEHLQGTP